MSDVPQFQPGVGGRGVMSQFLNYGETGLEFKLWKEPAHITSGGIISVVSRIRGFAETRFSAPTLNTRHGFRIERITVLVGFVADVFTGVIRVLE